MSTLLYSIKSKYCLERIFSYLPYELYLHITKGNKKLFKELNITKETYRNYYINKNINLISKIFISSYDINIFKYHK